MNTQWGILSFMCLILLVCALGCSPAQEEAVYTLGVCESGRPLGEQMAVSIPVFCDRDCSKSDGVWDIELRGKLAGKVRLTFDDFLLAEERRPYLAWNPSPKGEGIKYAGKVNHRGELVFEVGKGRGVLWGLRSGSETAPISATIRSGLDEDEVAATLRAEARKGTDFISGALIFEVGQRKGLSLLKSRRVIVNLSLCSKWRGGRSADKVTLVRNDSRDNAVILLDVRRLTGGCVRDELWRTTDSREIGNVLTPNNCGAEALVFSRGSAMRVEDATQAWHDDEGDDLPINLNVLKPKIPLTVFIMNKNIKSDTLVPQNLFDANVAYEFSRCGVEFFVDEMVDAIAEAEQHGLLDTSCAQVDRLIEKIPPHPGHLNVYYLGWPGAHGMWCEIPKVVLMSSVPLKDTLAHELGHSLSLERSNGILSPENLMYESGGYVREGLTVGQCYRGNMDPQSMLRVLGLRTDTPRKCLGAEEAKCPDIDREIQ